MKNKFIFKVVKKNVLYIIYQIIITLLMVMLVCLIFFNIYNSNDDTAFYFLFLFGIVVIFDKIICTFLLKKILIIGEIKFEQNEISLYCKKINQSITVNDNCKLVLNGYLGQNPLGENEDIGKGSYYPNLGMISGSKNTFSFKKKNANISLQFLIESDDLFKGFKDFTKLHYKYRMKTVYHRD
ncbi:hypothetical protein [Flammeovirga sp. SJP92]|uniref:hypothetical protein n=1 Tax=Flammeovirga sp. SJP92 TaxID=1775430 RepID=UPI000788B174|nr:hypothetical protein [Flammeovirga sp. SJP92]KXX68711.1 hypothetical protein AVL50_18740 [Flammeovirga sp. SJP92]